MTPKEYEDRTGRACGHLEEDLKEAVKADGYYLIGRGRPREILAVFDPAEVERALDAADAAYKIFRDLPHGTELISGETGLPDDWDFWSRELMYAQAALHVLIPEGWDAPPNLLVWDADRNAHKCGLFARSCDHSPSYCERCWYQQGGACLAPRGTCAAEKVRHLSLWIPYEYRKNPHAGDQKAESALQAALSPFGSVAWAATEIAALMRQYVQTPTADLAWRLIELVRRHPDTDDAAELYFSRSWDGAPTVGIITPNSGTKISLTGEADGDGAHVNVNFGPHSSFERAHKIKKATPNLSWYHCGVVDGFADGEPLPGRLIPIWEVDEHILERCGLADLCEIRAEPGEVRG